MSLDLQQNHFELFGLPVSFEIDRKALHQAQQRLQSRFHPDRVAGGSDQEKRLAVQQAAWINEAYQTLLDPVKRARYMLSLKGLDMNDEHETTGDTAFLMEQIELREEMEQCQSCQDPLRCCDHITGKLDQRSKEYAAEFQRRYEADDYEAARQIIKKMQFISRILEKIDEYQMKLEEELL
jgi:molecular chaperone HscB